MRSLPLRSLCREAGIVLKVVRCSCCACYARSSHLRGLDDGRTSKDLVVFNGLGLGDHHVDLTLQVLGDHAVAVGDLGELVATTMEH